jgi:hypothetical protein
MPRNVTFNHITTYTNEDLNIHHDAAGAVTAGVPVDIDITLHNPGGDVNAPVHVRLYWCGPNAGAPAQAQTPICDQLNPPVPLEGVPITVHLDNAAHPNGDTSATVSWTPSASILGTAASAHGCLFAQLQLDEIFPDYPLVSNPADWDPTHTLNAQHNLELVQVSKGTKSLKFAFGVGQPTDKIVPAKLRVEALSADDLQFVQVLRANAVTAKAIKRGRLVAPGGVSLTLGLERVIARELPLAASANKRSKGNVRLVPAIRLGHTGTLSDAIAKALAASRAASIHKLELLPGELRQAIVEITIPRSAKKGDILGAVVLNETIPTRTRNGKIGATRLIGSVGVAVQIV